MGRINVDVDLNGVTSDIEDAIEDGIRNSDSELYEEGTDVAKSKLRQEGAVWSGELISSFTFDTDATGKVRLVEIKNTSDHAAPIEEGAEYEDRGPPIDNLIPWVQDNLSDWQVGDYWIYRAKQSLDLHSSQFQAHKELYAKAFWLQQKIKRQGLEPRRFMEAMEDYLEQNADDIVSDEIDKELRKNL